MIQTKPRVRIAVIVITSVVAFCAILYGALLGTTKYWVKDVTDMSRAEVDALSLEQQYEQFQQNFDRMFELLTGAQRAIHLGHWRVFDVGMVTGGDSAPRSIPGATATNSYSLSTTRGWTPEGAKGARSDLIPLKEYVEAQGWKYAIQRWDLPNGAFQHMLRADTGDGWMISYTARSNGSYTLEVRSEVFWGDRKALQEARHARVADRGEEFALPGKNPEFPPWDAPLKESRQYSQR